MIHVTDVVVPYLRNKIKAMGLPFDHTEDPVEWVSYVEWETVPPA